MSSTAYLVQKLKLWLRAAETYARDANRQYTRIKRQLKALSTECQAKALDDIGKNTLDTTN